MKRTVSLFMAFVLVFALCVFASPQKARAIETGTLVYDPASTGEKFYYEGTTTEVAGKDTLWRISDDGSVLTLMDGFTYETSSDCALYVTSPGGSLMIEGSVTLGAIYYDEDDDNQVIYIINQADSGFDIFGSSTGAAPKLVVTNAGSENPYAESPYGVYSSHGTLNISDLELALGTAARPLYDCIDALSAIKLDNVVLTSYTYSDVVDSSESIDIKNSTLTMRYFYPGFDNFDEYALIYACDDVTVYNSTITSQNGGGCIASGANIEITDSSVTATGCVAGGITADCVYANDDTPIDRDNEITITNSSIDLKDFDRRKGIIFFVGIGANAYNNAKVTIKNSTVNALGSDLDYGITTLLYPERGSAYNSDISIIDSIVNAQGGEAAIGGSGLYITVPDDTALIFYPGTKTVNITGESTVDANGGAYGIYATDDINIALTGKGSVKATVPEVDHVGQAAIYASSASTITLAEDNIIVVPEGGGIIAVNDVELYGENGAEFVGVKAHPEYGPALDVEIAVKELAPKTGMDDNALLILIPVMAFALAAVFIVRAGSKKNAA